MAPPEGRREGARLPAPGRGEPIPVRPAPPDGDREERTEAAAGYAERRTRGHGPVRAHRGNRRTPRPARTAAGGARPALLRGPVRSADRGRDADQPRRGEKSYRAGHGRPASGPRGRLATEPALSSARAATQYVG